MRGWLPRDQMLKSAFKQQNLLARLTIWDKSKSGTYGDLGSLFGCAVTRSLASARRLH
jgi:hypothetical protein